MRETWPEPMSREDAIAAVEESRQSHVAWINWIVTHAEHLKNCERCRLDVVASGDTAHHERAVRKYDGVLAYLRG